MQRKIIMTSDVPICLFRSTMMLQISNNLQSGSDTISFPSHNGQNSGNARCVQLKLPSEVAESLHSVQAERRNYKIAFFRFIDFFMNICLLTSFSLMGFVLIKILS